MGKATSWPRGAQLGNGGQLPFAHLTTVLFAFMVFQTQALPESLQVAPDGGKGDSAQPEPKEPGGVEPVPRGPTEAHVFITKQL